MADYVKIIFRPIEQFKTHRPCYPLSSSGMTYIFITYMKYIVYAVTSCKEFIWNLNQTHGSVIGHGIKQGTARLIATLRKLLQICATIFSLHIRISTLYSKVSHLDVLREPHFMRQLRQEPHINKIKYIFFLNGFFLLFIQIKQLIFIPL